jgi:hypothetical protein
MIPKQLNQQYINRIKNFDVTLDTSAQVVDKALEILSLMCVASTEKPDASFYINTDDEGCIILEQSN